MRYNPPPNWPVPPGWSPGPGRTVDPSWPAPPPGWQFWVDDEWEPGQSFVSRVPEPVAAQPWSSRGLEREELARPWWRHTGVVAGAAVAVVVIVAAAIGIAFVASRDGSGSGAAARSASSTRPSGVTGATIRGMTFPAGTCGSSSKGWDNSVPITVRDGKGEARTASGEFGGASIRDANLEGWLDADGDGTEDAVVSFVCFGSTFDMCCAGRSSSMEFVRVFDFSNAGSVRAVGETIMPGSSPVRGEKYGESRRIEQVRIDGSAIITDEKLIYPDTSGATADLGYSPYATVEVTHRFADGHWESAERVLG